MGLGSWLRRIDAVVRYDFWLDYESVPGRRRRAERRELSATLRETADQEGVDAALRQVGPVRELARAVGEAYADRPRWAVGAYAAMPVFAILVYSWLFSSLAFLEGVVASGVEGRQVESTHVMPWLGTRFAAEVRPHHGGLSVAGQMPWGAVVLPLLVFLVVSRPWRLVTRHRAAPPVRA